MRNIILGLILTGAAAGCARSSVALDAPLESDHPLVVVAQAQPAPTAVPAATPASQESFAFPADKGGQAMGQLLRPPATLPALADVPPGPRPLPPPREVAHPAVPLPRNAANPAAPPGPKTAVLRPRALPEDAPLAKQSNQPVVPALRELATGARLQVPSRNVNDPVPLTILGLPLADRVPLDDPTMEASVSAALAVKPPARTEPIPFTPTNLPDPFANAQAVKLRTQPPEQPEPVAATPKTPGK